MPELFRQQLWNLLDPMFYADAQNANSLHIYLGGLSDPLFQLVEDWASDTDNDEPGYSLLVDATRVPNEGIAWLAQFVGVTLTQGLTYAQQREQLTGLASWKRGTIDAFKNAPLPWLSGTQTVIVKERDTSPYHLLVYTLASETIDQNAVLRALLSQKPAGLVLQYIVYSGGHAFVARQSRLRTVDQLRFPL
jgi:hypothetical protein